MTDRRRALRTAILHIVLVIGCIIFAFPFYWLVTTSMKERTEIFVSPPKWVPGIPDAVRSSPYASAAQYPEPRVPDRRELPFDSAGMATILDRLGRAGEERGPAETDYLAALSQGATALRTGLFNETAGGLPTDQWEGTAEQVADRLAARVTPDAFSKVFGNVFRGLRVGSVSVVDLTQRTYVPPGPEVMSAVSASATAEPFRGASARPVSLLTYDFAAEREAVFSITAPMPELQGGFAGVSIPVTGDRSWHSLYVDVNTPDGHYRAPAPYTLADELTVEWMWLLPEAESGFRKEKDYTDLERVGSGTAAPGTLEVTLRLVRRPILAATLAKFTRAYSEALRFIDFWKYLGNTVLIVSMSILGALFSCSLVAYGFARLSFPGRGVLFAVLLSTMMLPAQVTMVPTFLIFRYLGWYNTLLPLWAPSFLGSAFFIFMLRQFMKSIPNDLEDAAKIDGCGFFGIYWRIMLPLIKPALAAVAIFTFMGAWNNFMGPLIYLNDERLYPLSLGIYQFRMEHNAEYSMMMAASTLMMLPVLTVFFFAQRHFIQGVTLTGIKG